MTKKDLKAEVKSKILKKEISLKELSLIIHPLVRKKMREFYKKIQKKNHYF